MEIKTEEKDNINIDKYPDWCKDDVDKIICETLIKEKRKLTFTQLKNKVLQSYFEKANNIELIDRLNILKNLGILETVPKEVTPELWQVKEFREKLIEVED